MRSEWIKLRLGHEIAEQWITQRFEGRLKLLLINRCRPVDTGLGQRRIRGAKGTRNPGNRGRKPPIGARGNVPKLRIATRHLSQQVGKIRGAIVTSIIETIARSLVGNTRGARLSAHFRSVIGRDARTGADRARVDQLGFGDTITTIGTDDGPAHRRLVLRHPRIGGRLERCPGQIAIAERGVFEKTTKISTDPRIRAARRGRSRHRRRRGAPHHFGLAEPLLRMALENIRGETFHHPAGLDPRPVDDERARRGRTRDPRQIDSRGGQRTAPARRPGSKSSRVDPIADHRAPTGRGQHGTDPRGRLRTRGTVRDRHLRQGVERIRHRNGVGEIARTRLEWRADAPIELRGRPRIFERKTPAVTIVGRTEHAGGDRFRRGQCERTYFRTSRTSLVVRSKPPRYSPKRRVLGSRIAHKPRDTADIEAK